MYMMVLKNDVKFFADATRQHRSRRRDAGRHAIQVADAARALGVEPRIAMISFSNFGSAPHPESQKVAAAVEIVRSGGPTSRSTARCRPTSRSNRKLHELFPFSRLTDEANVLVFP